MATCRVELALGMCSTSGTGGFACEEKVKAKEMGIQGGVGSMLTCWY